MAEVTTTDLAPPPDFSKGMDAIHPWYDPIGTTNPRLIKLARKQVCPIEAVEFVNKPNMLRNTGFPKDYTAADFRGYCRTGVLLDGCEEKLDIFSYHYYNGISERKAPMMPAAYTPSKDA